jgi:hypothetical protein
MTAGPSGMGGTANPPPSSTSVQGSGSGTQALPASKSLVQRIMGDRYHRWVLFSVLFSLTPFGWLAAMVAVDKHISQTFDWLSLFVGGDIFLVCVAISVAAVGELIGSKKESTKGKLYSTVTCLGIILGCSMLYAKVRSTEPHDLDAWRIFSWSIAFFIGTFISGSACMLLSEE